jgi:hypothetical protein
MHPNPTMSDAPAVRPPDASPALRHLELIEAEVVRHRQNALRIRAGALFLVGGYIALHSAQSQPRYMFVAPALAIGAWILDAHADWNTRCLAWLSAAVRGETTPRPPPFSLDASPFVERVSLRSALLRPARAAYFQPLVMLASYIAIDAPRLDPDGTPSELFWYLAVTFLSFLTLVAVAWSWWLDRFGSTPAAPRVAASFQGGASLQGAPSGLPGGHASYDGAGPFPPREPRKDHTHPFGTAAG